MEDADWEMPTRERDWNNTNSIVDSESLAPGADAFSTVTIPEATLTVPEANTLWSSLLRDRQLEGSSTDIPSLKSKLTGAWKITSSDSDLYLRTRNLSELDDLAFERADVHIELTNDSVNIHNQLGGRDFHQKSFKLEEPMLISPGVSCISYFVNNSLKTIYLFTDENGRKKQEFETRKMNSDEELVVVLEREGEVRSERIYGRSQKENANNSMIERFHLAQLEAKIKRIEMEQTEKENKLQLEISTLQARLISLQVPEAPNSQHLFNGLWRNMDCKTDIFSLKLEGNKFMRKWSDSNDYLTEIVGVESAHGRVTKWEDGRLSQTSSRDNKELIWFIENGCLIFLKKVNGEVGRWVYERVGEPE